MKSSQGRKKPHAKTVAWSNHMAGHFRAILQTGKQQIYKVSRLCLGDYQFKQEEFESVGKIITSVLTNCDDMLVLGTNWKTRHSKVSKESCTSSHQITKWTRACDKCFARLISCIHHTSEFEQYCHVENTAQQCRLGLFQYSDFAGDFEDSKFTSGGTLCICGSHTFVPISWMCKKQTSVSHS